jgi:hypothetical protein
MVDMEVEALVVALEQVNEKVVLPEVIQVAGGSPQQVFHQIMALEVVVGHTSFLLRRRCLPAMVRMTDRPVLMAPPLQT